MSTAYVFGSVQLLPTERRLLIDGRPAALGQRAFDLLLALVERRERLVSKRELIELVWPGVVVEENNLQVQVSSLRKLLGPQAIATIPGRGYRFTARLAGAADAAPSPPDQAAGATPARLTNLPAALPELFGRDDELAALAALAQVNRLVTIVGAGGIGKSRLAQAAAHMLSPRWRDGAWMVELAGLSDPALLPNAVAQVFDIKVGGPAATDELAAGLSRRTALVVLDNCEHLLDAVAPLVETVLRGAPDVTILATSQEPLRLPEEQQYRLAPLAIPTQAQRDRARAFGALALFEARVRAVDPHFALTDENLALAIDICRRLDGLPLAIELAAARAATLGLRPLRDKLDARFRLLTGGARATMRRHQTLRAALEWSYNLLEDDERAVFRRLGAFAGGFTAELAQAVVRDTRIDEWAALDVLSALVDKSLVVADAGDTPRYRLLESARAFALEQLAAAEAADALHRHALAMRDFIEKVDGSNLDGELRTDQYAALVLPELDNLRAAYFWATGEDGDLVVAVALAAHSGSLIDYAVECADWLLPLRAHVESDAVPPALAARYWRAIAAGNMKGCTWPALRAEAAARALQLYRELGQPRRVFSTLMASTMHLLDVGDHAGAHQALEDARSLLRPGWPPEFRIVLLRRDAAIARAEKRFDAALALIDEQIRACVAARDWRLEVMARTHLIDFLWDMGELDRAALEARALNVELRAKPTASAEMDIHFANLMGILSELGEIEEASSAAREALPMVVRTRAYSLEQWAYLFWRRGQLETAALLLGASDAELAKIQTPRQVNEARIVAAARAGLAASLPTAGFQGLTAAGAALGERDMVAAISEAIAQPP